MADDAVPVTLEAIQTLLATSMQDMTNKYDKALKKQIADHMAPVVTDLQAQIKAAGGGGGKKKKKLEKARRRAEEAEAALAAAQGKPGKTQAEIDAEAATAAAASGKTKTQDMFKRREREELEERIKAIEEREKAALQRAAEAELDSALDRTLTDFPWESTNSRDLARNYYRNRLKRDDDGQIMIEDQKFDVLIRAEIPSKFENLLQARSKGGSGISKGTGKGPTLNDLVDKLGPTSTPEERAEVARGIAALSGQ